MVRAWRGQHGDACPGYHRAAHTASDLTVDHVVPLAAGGAPFDISNCAVLCRSCNSTKGAGGADRGSPHADSALLEDRAPNRVHAAESRLTDDRATVIPDEDAAPVFDPEDEPVDEPDVDAADAPEG